MVYIDRRQQELTGAVGQIYTKISRTEPVILDPRNYAPRVPALDPKLVIELKKA